MFLYFRQIYKLIHNTVTSFLAILLLLLLLLFIIIIIFFLAAPHGLQDFSSQTRDWTRTFSSGSVES